MTEVAEVTVVVRPGRTVFRDGRPFSPGQELVVPPKEAKRLLGLGAVRRVEDDSIDRTRVVDLGGLSR